MSPLRIGDVAAPVPGLAFRDGPTALFFYKVTCPTCQLAAPTMRTLHVAFPRRVVGIGQDPASELERFCNDYDMGIGTIEDAPPYRLSDAYAIESVPTLYLVDRNGLVSDVVAAWDRDGFNRVAASLAEDLGSAPIPVSTPDDRRPAFKPG